MISPDQPIKPFFPPRSPPSPHGSRLYTPPLSVTTQFRASRSVAVYPAGLSVRPTREVEPFIGQVAARCEICVPLEKSMGRARPAERESQDRHHSEPMSQPAIRGWPWHPSLAICARLPARALAPPLPFLHSEGVGRTSARLWFRRGPLRRHYSRVSRAAGISGGLRFP